MKANYPVFKRGQVEKIYNKLPKSEKKFYEEYLTYRKARGVSTDSKLMDIRRYLIHLRFILEKPISKTTLKDLRSLLAIINTSRLSHYVKNSIKSDLKNCLKFAFKDWSIRFGELDDIRLGRNGMNEEKINSKTIFSKEDIEKMLDHETSIYWRAYLLTQLEGGMRTIEARSLKWDCISLNVDGNISEIQIYATKTKKARTIFVKEATPYLEKLKEEQENSNTKGVYVFPSKRNKDEPITKSSVSMWFRRLTKKALGRVGWCYLLRHTKATELYRLADENKISKTTAIKFMGHSKDMSAKYTHLDKKVIKNMLKDQIYKTKELTEKELSKIESLEKQVKALEQSKRSHQIEMQSVKKEIINFKKCLKIPEGVKFANDEGEVNEEVVL